MSYDSDPTLYDYAPPPKECPLCHDAGETPDEIFVGLSGIQRGPLALPGDPPPPNGVFLINAMVPCHWAATIDDNDFNLGLDAPNSNLVIDRPGGPSYFRGLTAGPCQSWFANIQQNPAVDKYYGGWATLSNPLPSMGESAADIMLSIGFPPAAGTAVSPRAMTNNFSVFVFARDLDASNLKVKYLNP